MEPNPPKPISKAFVVCREIFQDQNTKEYILLGPTHQVFAPHFPVTTDLSIFSHWTSAHGTYQLELQLRDLEGNVLWCRPLEQPLEVRDPLLVGTVVFHHMLVVFPGPGKYEIAILANGQDVGGDVFWAHLTGQPRA